MEKIRNLSIRKTIVLYMFMNLILSFFVSYIVIQAAINTQQQIWLKYIDFNKYYDAIQGEGTDYDVHISRVSNRDMSKIDGYISELCDFLETYSVLLISSLGMIIMVCLFYKNKIMVPLSELREASIAIANNDLDFSVSYSNEDELGQLCIDFEKMRQQLEENNKQLWKMVEQEKALRSSIAHDIRSPLTILKGYQEMLLEFVPEEALDKEKILEMLKEGTIQIERMEEFLDTMKKLSKLEDRDVKLEKTNLSALVGQYRKNTEILANSAKKEFEILLRTDREQVWLDTGMALEVMENLLTNALRYAKKKVTVLMVVKNSELSIEVQDDGLGFTENADVLTKAYYHSNPQDDLKHFGLGLYICRIYCEKHGGKLLLGNLKDGGGSAIAIFSIGNEKDWVD